MKPRPRPDLNRLSYRGLIIPLVLAGIFVVLLVARGSELVKAIYLNSDAISAPVITSFLGASPAHSVITLGNYPWYESMWFMLATKWLPHHRDVWFIAPVIFTAIAFLLIILTAWDVFGSWVAGAVLVPLVCVSYGMRQILFALDWHGALVLHGAVLGATLVVLSKYGPRWSLSIWIGVGVFLAIFTAIGVSDQLLLVTGVLPYMATGVFVWWRTRQSRQAWIAIFAITTGVLAIIGGKIANIFMHDLHIVPSPFHLKLVSASGFGHNGKLLLDGLAYLGGGYSPTGHITANGILTLAAVSIVLLWLCVRAVFALPGSNDLHKHQNAALLTYVTFWGLTIACTFGAFLLSTAPTDVSSARYIAVAFVGIVALLPVLSRSNAWARGTLTAGLGVFATLTIINLLADGIGTYGTGPSQSLTKQIERYVTSHELDYGYAEYQDAAVLTWQADLRINVYPVERCDTNQLCPFYLHTISSWYEARQGVRSFLITDSSPALIPVSTPPVNLGHPLSSTKIGYLTVYEYDYDIADRFGRLP